MTNWIKVAVDGIGLVHEGEHDIDAAVHGTPYTTTQLAEDIVREIADVGFSEDWLNAAVVEEALQLAFSFIKAKNPHA